MMRSPRRTDQRRRRGRDSVESQNAKGLLIIGISGAVVLTFVVLSFTVFRVAKVDPRTGCPSLNATPIAHTVILVDETDKLTKDELVYARTLVLNEYYWLPIGGRLTVRNIVHDAEEAHDILVCRIDNGDGVLGIGKNPKKVRQDFERIAGARLNELFKELEEAPPQQSSPILEYTSAVVDKPTFGPNIKNRRLVLLSDMAQHSDLVTHYGSKNRFSLNAGAREELTRDMSGIHVRVHYVKRRALAGLQSERHRAFWKGYFESMGADAAIGHSLLIGEDPSRSTWTDNS